MTDTNDLPAGKPDDPQRNTPGLFARLSPRRYLNRERADWLMCVSGLTCLASPLVLWVSWSPDALKGIFCVAIGAYMVTRALAEMEFDDE